MMTSSNIKQQPYTMKKITLLAILLITSLSTLAQEEEKKESEEVVKKNEVTLNAFSIIAFKTLDFSYEYLLNSEASVGISVLINLQNENNLNDTYYNESFAITPYYRHFFSRKYAQGFFIEAFGMYNQQKNYYYVPSTGNTSNNFALGMSIGGKFVSRNGFIYEFFLGAGRNLAISNHDVATEVVPRLAASIGYRF